MNLSTISFQRNPVHFNSSSLSLAWAGHILLREGDLVLRAQKDILRTCFLESDSVGNLHFPTPADPSNVIAWNVLIIIHWLKGVVWMSVSQLLATGDPQAGCLGAQDVFFGRNPLPWISFLCMRQWGVGSHFGCDCLSLFFYIRCSIPSKNISPGAKRYLGNQLQRLSRGYFLLLVD